MSNHSNLHQVDIFIGIELYLFACPFICTQVIDDVQLNHSDKPNCCCLIWRPQLLQPSLICQSIFFLPLNFIHGFFMIIYSLLMRRFLMWNVNKILGQISFIQNEKIRILLQCICCFGKNSPLLSATNNPHNQQRKLKLHLKDNRTKKKRFILVMEGFCEKFYTSQRVEKPGPSSSSPFSSSD